MNELTPRMAENIELRSVEELIPYANNARTHSDSQVVQIANSIIEFGFTNPILIDGTKGIIAGHGRLMAAKKLNLSQVPVVVLDHLSEAQKKAYIIADNKLAENAGWDEEILAGELADLKEENFDLDLIGFEDQELEKIFSNLYDDNKSEKDDDVPELEENPVSKVGDIWILGNHKLICGDSTKIETYQSLLENELADMTFTDPPYNVDYDQELRNNLTSRSIKGSDKYEKESSGKRKISNDNLGDAFPQFLFDCCSNILAFTKGACYICMSSSELPNLQKAFIEAGGKWSTFIIWAKNHFTLGRSDYQRQYEPILYGWKEKNDHYWCGDRNQSDVWYFNKPLKSSLHPTMKPVELVKKAILNSSKTEDIILDPFGGSGSTLIAAEQVNRRCRTIELDEKYVDVIIKRWQDISGKEAILLKSGKNFNDILKERTNAQ